MRKVQFKQAFPPALPPPPRPIRISTLWYAYIWSYSSLSQVSCGWRSKRKSQGEFSHACALYVFAFSEPDACHARLDFRRGRRPGSFPKQRLVIEPTARQANTLAKANTSVRSPTEDIWPPLPTPIATQSLKATVV